MPTRPRIDLAGYHHVINRGVNRCDTFNNDNDKDMFLQIVNKTANIHDVTVHTYCLMDNHYHMLIQTKYENLPAFMRIVNANYALYFNKKYNRSGHLWQDRYKSKYVLFENYLYSIIKYIEYNPVEANMYDKVGEYKFTLFHNILNNKKHIYCARSSIMFTEFSINDLSEFLTIKLSEDELNEINIKHKIINNKLKYEKEEIIQQNIKYFFNINQSKEQRNTAIIKAYKNKHTQVEISNYLNLSKSTISKIIKNGDSTPGV